MRECEPTASTTLPASMLRVAPDESRTSTVNGSTPVKRASPRIGSAPALVSALTWLVSSG